MNISARDLENVPGKCWLFLHPQTVNAGDINSCSDTNSEVDYIEHVEL